MLPAPARKVLEIDDPVTKIATVSSLGQIGGGDMSSCAPAPRSPRPAAHTPPPAPRRPRPAARALPPAAAVCRRSWRARQARGAGVALGAARGARWLTREARRASLGKRRGHRTRRVLRPALRAGRLRI